MQDGRGNSLDEITDAQCPEFEGVGFLRVDVRLLALKSHFQAYALAFLLVSPRQPFP
jgi:hypothetical protein